MKLGSMEAFRFFAVVLATASVSLARATPIDGVLFGRGSELPQGYSPALISNGDVSLGVDPWLGVSGTNCFEFSSGIFRAGRRYMDGWRCLYPQGSFKTIVEVDGKVADIGDWRQELNIETASCLVENDFGGVRMSGRVFVPTGRRAIVIRQVFSVTDARTHDVRAGLDAMAPDFKKRLVGDWRADVALGAKTYAFRAYARTVNDAALTVGGADGTSTEPIRKFRLEPGEERTLDWYLTMADTLDEGSGNPVEMSKVELSELRRIGHDALLAAHVRDWGRYYAERAIDIPDARLMRMTKMAEYHLRCVGTRWSFPIGIMNSHWAGRVFAFDEMYAVQGLLAAGHFNLARKASDFRKATLPQAIGRNAHKTSKEHFGYGARWVWETMEGLNEEGSIIGYWLDHIFHMAAIARTCYLQYQYTGDERYLRETCYPVMRECARYFRTFWVYDDKADGTSFIGKCTDFERLGPAKERPFMTTIGVIHTFRIFAEAAEILGTDGAEAAEYLAVAERLEKGLPVWEDRYASYLGTDKLCVGLLAGFFPFPTFGRDNVFQMNAAKAFLEQGKKAGNMYPMGREVCPWYAGTMSVAALRMGDGEAAYRWVDEAWRSAGVWGEYYEINEPGVAVCKPWFMTAAGNCLYAVCKLLVTEEDGEIRIAAGVPKSWEDFSFRLPVSGGRWIEMKAEGGKLAKLSVSDKNGRKAEAKTVLPDWLCGKGFSMPEVARPRRILLDGCDAECVSLSDDGVVTIAGAKSASFVTLEWSADLSGVKVLNDEWERTYGETGWREVGARPSPWYFLATDGERTDALGVAVQPNAFACWLAATNGVKLKLDLRAGSRPVRLDGRRLDLCRIVLRRGRKGETPFEAGRDFCRMMCPSPRLPSAPVYGYNDWYCAYGKNSATNFLLDLEFVMGAMGGAMENPPFAIVDDGWQLRDISGFCPGENGEWTASNPRWGMAMDEFARRVKALGARPGLWYRPLNPWRKMPDAWRMTSLDTWENGRTNGCSGTIDPTAPGLREKIIRDLMRFRSWGMEAVKIDFITYDWNGRWGFALGETIIDHEGCVWRDDSRTGAEVVRSLYEAMREGAGDEMMIIGCNAVNHFAAGLFELQRIGDDTSGYEWSRTCKMGPNTLGMRAIQNGTFFLNDGDCVGLKSEGSVPWEKNRQWLDLVSRSGTALFVSWKRQLGTVPAVRDALGAALRHASLPQPTGEPLDWISNIRPSIWKFSDVVQRYDWR